MASVAAAEEERRERIMAHMNRSHTRELAHYLRHYAGASRRDAAADPRMCDLTLQGMRIRAGGADYAIPFAPPLDSWNEVKQRIIDMDAAARESLGISDVLVDRFAPPAGFDRVVFAAVLFYFASVASLPWLVPGTTGGGYWSLVDSVFPGGAEWYRWTVRVLFLPVLGIHTTEAFIFDKKLQRHGVDRWSGNWWLWVSSCFMEGVMAFRRLDGIVADKRRAKEGKKQ